MACFCHGKKGEAVKVTSPYDQCTTCARKHVKNAWGAFGEFTYEDDNRDYVSDQLRKAADHLKYEHREIALLCRDMAISIEENKDKLDYASISEALNDLRIATRELYYKEHPDAKQRLEEMKNEDTAFNS
jgi:hypothetical protein